MRHDPIHAKATGTHAAPRARNIPILDSLRAFAILGVVLMNSIEFADSAEDTGAQPVSALSAVTENVIVVLLGGKCRTLLMVLLGIGLVLMWRSSENRDGRPGRLLLRRYVSLIVLFGIPHSLLFAGDFLVHYAIVALALLPFLRILLNASRNSIFAIAMIAVLVNAALHSIFPSTIFDLTSTPTTFAAFCLGVWLARTVASTDVEQSDNSEQKKAATRMLRWGMLGLAVSSITYRLHETPDESALATASASNDGLPFPWSFTQNLSVSLMLIFGALLFFGLLWDLYLKNGIASRALTSIAPVGRMTLTTYLGSTVLFLAVFSGRDGEFGVTAQFGTGAVYFIAMLVLATLWFKYFKFGPCEWIWRCATYFRLLPIRRTVRPKQ